MAGAGSVRGDAGRIIGASVAALAADWFRLAAPLYAMRAARILHFAAAALALGVIAGLYVRGLALEYRATWESTFLDAADVRRLLAVLLAPGSALTGIAMPGVAQVESIRAPFSENAATWLHLLAASVVAIVVIPRLLLAVGTGIIERHRAARVPIPLGEPYYQRLLRGFRGGPVRVRVIPYSYAVPSAALAGLEAIVARAFGGSAAMTVEAPLAYGDEDTLAERAPTDGQGPVIALFNLTATPEPAAHGAFVKAATGVDPAQPLLALVDESAFRARWPGDDRRLAQRRGIWSEMLTAQRVVPIFVNLAAPDLAFAAAAIDAALVCARHDRAHRADGIVTDRTPIALSLISHTNAGKTTLARTLLSRDVGEVRDAPHVTTEVASFPLVETADGDALILWDTPGFGDSARLARRLRQQGNPVGWFLSQVWDRFRDRPFWLTQKAVRNVRDQADVVLYLVNASEEPARRRLPRAGARRAGMGRQARDRAAQPDRAAARARRRAGRRNALARRARPVGRTCAKC